MSDRGEADADLEAAVEAEYQAGVRRTEAVNRMQSGIHYPGVPSRRSIRERLKRERKEALEAEERRLRVELLRRQMSVPHDATESRPADEAESKRGKWQKDVSESEANKAVEIYLKNIGFTPWEVWVRYERVKDTDDPLSRRMVARLIEDLEGDEPLLIWDETAVRVDGGLGRLRRTSGELWANFGRGVLPRREPAS